MEQQKVERSLFKFWHCNHVYNRPWLEWRSQEHKRWIGKVRHSPQGVPPLKKNRKGNIWVLLQEQHLDIITFIHKTCNHNASQMQTVMAGREADPHNIWFCLPEIRSLCRPRFTVQEGTLSYEDIILFSASEFNSNSEEVNFSQWGLWLNLTQMQQVQTNFLIFFLLF